MENLHGPDDPYMLTSLINEMVKESNNAANAIDKLLADRQQEIYHVSVEMMATLVMLLKTNAKLVQRLHSENRDLVEKMKALATKYDIDTTI